MEVAENKKWAVGMNQQQFTSEFKRRVVNAGSPPPDAIPNVDEWLLRPELKYHGIPPINPEKMTIDGQAKKEEKKEDPVLYCRGCKREFKHVKGNRMAQAAHERYCKALLNMKL